jgi:multiple sugar transport system substrate-binding protein
MTETTRRRVLAGACAAASRAVLPRGLAAQDKPAKLTIIAHRVHQLSATEGPAGDPTASWRARTGVGLEWVTLDLNAIHDRLFREASLRNSQISVGFMLNARATADAMKLFEPLEPFMAKAPIEDFGDISPRFTRPSRPPPAMSAFPTVTRSTRCISTKRSCRRAGSRRPRP